MIFLTFNVFETVAKSHESFLSISQITDSSLNNKGKGGGGKRKKSERELIVSCNFFGILLHAKKYFFKLSNEQFKL